jgi:hypothetical protein
MLCVLLLVAALIAAYVIGTWPKTRWSLRDAGDGPADPAAPGHVSTPQRSPETLEGTLTLQLVAGEITGPQYQHAMAAVAARDAERHPLEVPPEVNPPEAV